MKQDLNLEFIPGKTRIKYGGAFTDKADFDAIESVLSRNWWTIDEEGRSLERELRQYALVDDAILTNSGSSALMIAFAALGFPEGSEIITGAVHFPTAISALYYNRLTPVFVDIEELTLGINPDLIEKAITKKTKAILVVALSGSIPHIDRILDIAKKHNLKVVLDNCDGFGGTWQGIPLEYYFDVACTSFHAAHIMSMGEGGAIFSKDPVISEKARSMREWGRIGDTDDVSGYEGIPEDYPGRYIFKYMGFNVKPLELQCAMGRTQLRKLDLIKKLRTKNFKQLWIGLNKVAGVKLISNPPGSDASWFGFPLFATNRKYLRNFLEARGIETRTIFGGNITKQPAFKGFGRIEGELKVSDKVMTEGMFISTHPSNTSEMNQYMIDSIKEFYA